MLDYLCEECRDHFEQLQECLKAEGIPFVVDSRIVRGLDYYTKTVFELVTETEGGNLTVCGGGRYDHLASQLGGPDLPAVGFGMGIERVLMLLDSEGIVIPRPDQYEVFVTYMMDYRMDAFTLVQALRRQGIRADMDHCARSLKAQFKYANKTGAPFAATIGEEEAKTGTVRIKNMGSGEERTVPKDEVGETIQNMRKEAE